MHDELTARQRAISLRLAGRSVNYICSALGRVKAWFHKWWGRYLQAGPEGLYDLTRANHHVAQRTKQFTLESADALARRIEEAAKNVPLERLAISPQCGFGSDVVGNLISEDDQKRKLERAVETARKVWR